MQNFFFPPRSPSKAEALGFFFSSFLSPIYIHTWGFSEGPSMILFSTSVWRFFWRGVGGEVGKQALSIDSEKGRTFTLDKERNCRFFLRERERGTHLLLSWPQSHDLHICLYLKTFGVSFLIHEEMISWTELALPRVSVLAHVRCKGGRSSASLQEEWMYILTLNPYHGKVPFLFVSFNLAKAPATPSFPQSLNQGGCSKRRQRITEV